MQDIQENTPVILDCGTETTRAGFGEMDQPTKIFPTLVGKPIIGFSNDFYTDKLYFGSEIESKKGLQKYKHPIKQSSIVHWDYMTLFWRSCFNNELRIETTQRPVLLTEPPRTSQADRERILEIFFEDLEVPALSMPKQANLGVLGQGLLTGLVCEMGHGSTYLTPVYEGFSQNFFTEWFDICGKDIDDYMTKLLQQFYPTKFTSSKDIHIVRNIKEQFGITCKSRSDFVKKVIKHTHMIKEFEQPDGEEIQFAGPGLKCPEIYFQPDFIGRDFEGLNKAIVKCIKKTNYEQRKLYYDAIILSGGSSCFENLEKRLCNEIKEDVPHITKPKVIIGSDQDHRKNNVWVGGASVACLSSFNEAWITKEEYYDYGASVLDFKPYYETT